MVRSRSSYPIKPSSAGWDDRIFTLPLPDETRWHCDRSPMARTSTVESTGKDDEWSNERMSPAVPIVLSRVQGYCLHYRVILRSYCIASYINSRFVVITCRVTARRPSLGRLKFVLRKNRANATRDSEILRLSRVEIRYRIDRSKFLAGRDGEDATYRKCTVFSFAEYNYPVSVGMAIAICRGSQVDRTLSAWASRIT